MPVSTSSFTSRAAPSNRCISRRTCQYGWSSRPIPAGSCRCDRLHHSYTPPGTRVDMALLTVRAAAERLGVGYSTLKHWIYEGRVRTTQTPGGHHRIADAEIDRLTAHHTPPARSSS